MKLGLGNCETSGSANLMARLLMNLSNHDIV